jgi:hypothetical protein
MFRKARNISDQTHCSVPQDKTAEGSTPSQTFLQSSVRLWAESEVMLLTTLKQVWVAAISAEHSSQASPKCILDSGQVHEIKSPSSPEMASALCIYVHSHRSDPRSLSRSRRPAVRQRTQRRAHDQKGKQQIQAAKGSFVRMGLGAYLPSRCESCHTASPVLLPSQRTLPACGETVPSWQLHRRSGDLGMLALEAAYRGRHMRCNREPQQ